MNTMKIERGGKVRVDTCNLFFNLYQPPATLSEGMVFAKSITRYLLPHVPAVSQGGDGKSDDRHGGKGGGARMGLEKESSAHIGSEHP